MKTLIITDRERCTDCGNCESHIRGFYTKNRGVLRVRENEWEHMSGPINKAIADCFMDCLAVVDDIQYMYKCQKCGRSHTTKGDGSYRVPCPTCRQQSAIRVT